MTATLHALGSGRGAGAYYTEDLNREARPRSRDNYYTRDGGGGTWWSTASGLVKNGSSIDRETFHDLCAGLDPRSGKGLVRGSGAGHRAGWDITFSAPKSFGILWAAGTVEQRAVLEKMHQDAVDQALQFVVDERLVEVRLGAAGHLREAPSDILVAKFPHFTSRAGDMACHTHCVLLNVAQSSGDRKKYLTVEPRQAYAWQAVIGAAFRTALSQNLVEMGFSVRVAGRNQFEITGIPETMIEHFSKRSQQIKARVGPGASAAQKEIAALATRCGKASVPTGEELERRWQQEFAIFDIDPWRAGLEAGRLPQPLRAAALDQDLDPPEVPGESPVALAASEIFRTESVVQRKALFHRALVEASLQGRGIKNVYACIADHEASGKLVRLDRHESAQHWTTTNIAAREAKLLRLVKERIAGSWFRPEAIEAALKNASSLSEEQRQAVRHATSTDPTSLLEAGAGTGKTTLAKAVAQAATKSGLRILGLSPSWVAADELSRSTGVEAVAIARFRHELAAGKRQAPDSNTLVIIDEAGMVSTRDMAAIFDACTARGTSAVDGEQQLRSSKILLCGDRRQLESVAGASAFKAVSDLIERRSTLTGVRRQTIDWQRAASVAMAQGDSEAGLRAYAEHDRIEIVAGREGAQARTIKAWQNLRRTHGDDVIVVTRRNRDAVSLNLAAREVLREDGLIQGKDVSLTAIDRDNGLAQLPIARGDCIRFGETLHQHGIRNGTRGNVVGYTQGIDGSVRLAIRLDDGRVIEDTCAGFSQKGRRRNAGVPKIVHAVAGSAYSVQGRTALATVYHIASATDAREAYCALTRHRHDVRIVVESGRLDADCRARQEDPRMPPTQAAMQERLFIEARRYNEKANVVDHVEDRMSFIATGIIELAKPRGNLDIGIVAKAAGRIQAAAQQIGAVGRDFAVQLRQLTGLPLNRAMPDDVKTIVETVKSWIQGRGLRKAYGRDPHIDGYGW
jgi:conjugative relaxase-like TrwC/TraI family protein